MHPKTIAEKILSTHSGTDARPGEIVFCTVDVMMAHDANGPLAVRAFQDLGGVDVCDPRKIHFIMDHGTPAPYERIANLHQFLRDFAAQQGIDFIEGGEGVCHQLMMERGYVKPGDIVLGTDSHTCTYGGIGAFSTGLGSTDIACGMVLGRLWFKVPASIRVNIEGSMPKWIRGKDLILRLIGEIGVDGALYRALEFGGSALKDVDIEGRLCMANMAIEAGGKCGLFPSDELTAEYCKAHSNPDPVALSADEGAEYERVVTMDVTGMEPVVACPHLPENTRPVSELSDIAVDQVVIGSCTNGRISDMRDAAEVLKGRKVAKGVRCIVIPATPAVWRQAMDEGLFEIFSDAGCVISTPTCGPCLGGYMGVLGDGERCISTSNRNFRGRMGSLESELYLASPCVAAASAVTGVITGPDKL